LKRLGNDIIMVSYVALTRGAAVNLGTCGSNLALPFNQEVLTLGTDNLSMRHFEKEAGAHGQELHQRKTPSITHRLRIA